LNLWKIPEAGNEQFIRNQSPAQRRFRLKP
jgi:hypothetical protein